MDANMMNVAMSTLATAGMGNVRTLGSTGGAASGDAFAQMLMAMMGTGMMDSGSGLFGSSGDDLLGGGLGGMSPLLETSLQQLQMSMMSDALKSLLNAEKPLVTDPVLAELLQKLNGETDGQALEQLLEDMKKRLLEMVSQNGTEMAGQQAIALFAQLMEQMTGMPLADETLQALGSDGGQNLLQLMTQGGAEDILKLLDSMPQNAQANGQAVQAEQPAQADALAQDVTDVQVEKAPAQPPDFQQAVRQVIDRMQAGEAAKDETPEPDADALQQQVDAGVHVRNTALADGLATAQATANEPLPVTTQLYEGVNTALAAGQEEIVVRLAPQELGEVTIRLLKTEEGMRLSLIAKNPETQQLLASQIDALQDRMQPYKVAVEDILTEQQYQMLNNHESFDGQRRSSWQAAQNSRYATHAQPAAEQAEAVAPSAQRAPTTGLDTYI